MSYIGFLRIALCVLAVLGLARPVLSATSPNVTTAPYALTTYDIEADRTQVWWRTSGKTAKVSGSFGGGVFSGLGGACQILEGIPRVVQITHTTMVYVVEASSTKYPNAVLDIYQRTDVLNPTNPTSSAYLVKRVDLGLKVGLNTPCFMAGNARYLYIGVPTANHAVRVNKTTLALAPVGGFSPPILVSKITADSAGNVSVVFGKTGAANQGALSFGPDGTEISVGGIPEFVANTTNGTPLQ